MDQQTKSPIILVVREKVWESWLNDTVMFGWMIAATLVSAACQQWVFTVILVGMWAAVCLGRTFKLGTMKAMTPAEAKQWLAQQYPATASQHNGPWCNGRTMGFAPPPRKEN